MDQFTSTWSKGKRNISGFDLLMWIVPVSYWYLNVCCYSRRTMKSVLQKRLFAWCPIPLKSIAFLNSQADPKFKKKKKILKETLLTLQKSIRLQDWVNPVSVLLHSRRMVALVDYGLAALMEFLWAQWWLGKGSWPPPTHYFPPRNYYFKV